jgi:hypothetical protein
MGHGAVTAIEDTTTGDRDESLVRAVESRFKETPGYNCSLEAEFSNAIATVHNFRWAQGIECKLDPVSAH